MFARFTNFHGSKKHVNMAAMNRLFIGFAFKAFGSIPDPLLGAVNSLINSFRYKKIHVNGMSNSQNP